MGVTTINNEVGGLTAEKHEGLESLASYTPNMNDVNLTRRSNYGNSYNR